MELIVLSQSMILAGWVACFLLLVQGSDMQLHVCCSTRVIESSVYVLCIGGRPYQDGWAAPSMRLVYLLLMLLSVADTVNLKSNYLKIYY